MNTDYLFVPFTPDWERRRDYHIMGYPRIWSIYLTPVDPVQSAEIDSIDMIRKINLKVTVQN